MFSISTENTNNVPPGFDKHDAAKYCLATYCALGNAQEGKGECAAWGQCLSLQEHFEDPTEILKSPEFAERVINLCPYGEKMIAIFEGKNIELDSKTKK